MQRYLIVQKIDKGGEYNESDTKVLVWFVLLLTKLRIIIITIIILWVNYIMRWLLCKSGALKVDNYFKSQLLCQSSRTQFH